MDKQREIWIDCIKGLTIIVVVVLHIPFDWNVIGDSCAIQNFIGDAWDMPVFFLVGGFFLNIQQLKHPNAFIWHKFDSLYLKLLYYYIPILLLHNVFLSVGLYNPSYEYGGKYMTYLSIPEMLLKMLGVVFFTGREPFASPLWFVYVLFEAFILLSVGYRILNYIYANDDTKARNSLFIAVIIFSVASFFCTNVLNVTIPRCSNVLPAMWLILLGYVIKQQMHISFTDWRAFLLSLTLMAAVCAFSEHMAMMTNSYKGIIQLTLCGCSALYVIGYISKKMESTILGKVLAIIGKYSFEIMALHLLSISLFAWFLNVAFKTDLPVYKLGCCADNWYMLVLFSLAGVFIPIFAYLLFKTIALQSIAIWKRH